MKWTSIEKPPNPLKVKKLYLCDMELTILPDWINLCKNLQLINCNQNNITSLPNDLPNSVEIIRCHTNNICTLPNNLPKNILIINCANNKLSILPELPISIHRLICSYNCISELPEKLPPDIQEIDCSYNKLTTLPLSIINHQLQKLIVVGNNFSNLHPAIISYLIASQCELPELTEWTIL